MYKVYCDSYLLHDDLLEDDSLYKIFSPSLQTELNTVGSFSFSVRPEHPAYNLIQKMKSIITVYEDDNTEPLFRGRCIEDVQGFYNEKQVSCEGELAFLFDSIQRPYEFSGTPEELFNQLIDEHNEQVQSEKQFTVGVVTVTDPNDYIIRSDETYLNTFESIKKKLIDDFGGYLNVRHVGGVNYIDYLVDFDLQSTQSIEFGNNLIDFGRTITAENFATAIIPLGAKDETTGQKIGIASVNDGVDYVTNATAAAEYGPIFTTHTWNDVTDPSNLKTKAQAYIDSLAMFSESIEVTAADLYGTGADVNSFKIGRYITVHSVPQDISQSFLVSAVSKNLMNPESTTLVLGSTRKTLTDIQSNQNSNSNNNIIRIENSMNENQVNNDNAIHTLERNTETSIQQTSESILSQVSDNYYLKDQTDALISAVSSSFEQTAQGFEMQFTQIEADIDAVASGADAEFEEFRKYIRFVDGKILLGEVGNELELQIANDKISFIQNNTEVAYFTDRKLYVTDGEYTNSLQLGKFAFIPRENGNLSFKKVVE